MTHRGYQLVSFENVLGRSLQGLQQPVPPSGVEVRLSDDRAAWLDIVVEGFAHPDGEGVPSHEDFPREIVEKAIGDIEQAGATPYLAFSDGVLAGGASMRMSEGVAQLTVQPRCGELADAAAPAATSPSSRTSRVRNRSRMCSAEAFTCSTPARFW